MEEGQWSVGWDGRVETAAEMGLETEEEERASSRLGRRRLAVEETPAVGSLAKYLSLIDGVLTMDQLLDPQAEELEADQRCVELARRGVGQDHAALPAASVSRSADALSALDDKEHENPALALVCRRYPALRPLILARLRRQDAPTPASSISLAAPDPR